MKRAGSSFVRKWPMTVAAAAWLGACVAGCGGVSSVPDGGAAGRGGTVGTAGRGGSGGTTGTAGATGGGGVAGTGGGAAGIG
ncbi:MAG TPA: hypothetical protein VN903_00355, partial [Polyangia bacterium]|nr:hypothetical protein [Polyangia bacterium]